jgi:hypothetical protein
MKKYLPYIIILVIFLVLVLFGISFLKSYRAPKFLKLTFPRGGEEIEAGNVYQIRWESNKVENIGLVLINEEKNEKKVLVENFPASKKQYQWQVFLWQNPGQNYRLAIFEYPWEEGKLIFYSSRFTILGPTLPSCDKISVESQWPFIPSDFPDLKRVFITPHEWNGDLGGLEGADQKCQEEAKNLGLEGNFKAFLGDDQNPAVERINLDGIFVEAKPFETLPLKRIPPTLWENFGNFLKTSIKNPRQKESFLEAYKKISPLFQSFVSQFEKGQSKKNCYRLIAKNSEEFLKIFNSPKSLLEPRFSPEFLNNFSKIWIGRITKESQIDCILLGREYFTKKEIFSFTTTCQNWKNGGRFVVKEEGEYPICYNEAGNKIEAIGIGGLSLDLDTTKNQFFPSAKYFCDETKHLLCIEQ